MRVTTDLSKREPGPGILTIGSFDGVHLGHRALIDGVVASAHEKGIPAVALTFEPSPREVLRPGQPVAYLTRLPQKLAIFEKLGLDETVVVKFTKKLSKLEAPEFIKWVREH